MDVRIPGHISPYGCPVVNPFGSIYMGLTTGVNYRGLPTKCINSVDLHRVDLHRVHLPGLIYAVSIHTGPSTLVRPHSSLNSLIRNE